MRELRDRPELDAVKDAQYGYILNERPEVKRLHRVTCNYVAIMWTNPHPKFFFAGLDEARQWADERYGQYPHGWVPCGHCHPFDNQWPFSN